MGDTHGTFTWYELMAAKPQTARDFYGRLLGWRYEPMPAAGGSYDLIDAGGLQVGGVLTLTPGMIAGGAHPVWLGYIEVDDLESAVARVPALGGTIVMGITPAGEAGSFALACDPQGAFFYLFHSARGARPDYSNAPGRVAWRELRTTDLEAGLSFYGQLCGWQRDARHDMGGGMAYQVFRTAGTVAGGAMSLPGVQRAHWLYYFAVPSVAQAATQVEALGGHVLHGPAEVPGGQWMLDARDPQGVEFALLGAR